ncbi:MAG: TRAP transporter substrate-binding protein DctP [Acidobacteria bacterium]|nr:TRAP transporter substrate-binding protein DctP [Acidobacteriota bacterium]
MIKKLIAALAVLAFAVSNAPASPASSGAVVIKIGSIAPSRSPWDKALEKVARDWERISNGTVQVRIFPGGIAGSELDMIRKMRLGVLQGGVFTSMGLSKIESSVTVLNIPLLFHSAEEFGVVFDKMKPAFEKKIEEKGFKVVLWTLAGWVNFFTKEPVIYPEDLKKLKISVTDSDPEIEQVWKKMGYQVVPGDFKDLMVQLQSGMVSAAYLPPLLAGSGQYFAVIPHMLSMTLAPLVAGLILSDKAWASIPADLHQPFIAAIDEASRGLFEEAQGLAADAVKMMKENGLIVHDAPPAALEKWRQAAAEGVKDLIGPRFSKEMYDQIVGYIQEFRKARGK